jgi:hypothetical protein
LYPAARQKARVAVPQRQNWLCGAKNRAQSVKERGNGGKKIEKFVKVALFSS